MFTYELTAVGKGCDESATPAEFTNMSTAQGSPGK